MYVDPATGVHTNNIEARWNACKVNVKARFGTQWNIIPAYIDEHTWRSRHDHNNVFGDLVALLFADSTGFRESAY